ncbi:MAG: spermidine/putrescine ABC transporter substrate-binding protein [Desulfobacterales bacterium]|jgi:spermidine/putrescine transport system substrate-binding protein
MNKKNTSVKFLIVSVIIALVATISGNPVLSADKELNILTWCDHTDPALLQPFEQKHNLRINLKEYDGTGVALALLEQSQPGDWDVFIVDSIDVKRVVKLGLLEPLNPKDFPWDDIFPEIRTPELHNVDGKLYAVPEKFGYNTIAYNNKKVAPADMRDAAVLWNPKYKGRIAVYDYYIPVIEMVAIGLGIKPPELNQSHLPAIKEKLFKMKEYSALVGDVVQVQTALATGEVDIIAGGGEFAVSVLHKENPALDWVLPDQGGVRWQQAIGVFSASKKKDLALKFVQYILSPEGQGRLATSSCYWAMPANSKAVLTPEQKKILRWDEQPKFLANSFFYLQPDEAFDKAMLDVWTEFLQH